MTMKITKSKIMEIIREEINKLQEATWARSGTAQPHPRTEKPPAISDRESEDPRRWGPERKELQVMFDDLWEVYHQAEANGDSDLAKLAWAELVKFTKEIEDIKADLKKKKNED